MVSIVEALFLGCLVVVGWLAGNDNTGSLMMILYCPVMKDIVGEDCWRGWYREDIHEKSQCFMEPHQNIV